MNVLLVNSRIRSLCGLYWARVGLIILSMAIAAGLFFAFLGLRSARTKAGKRVQSVDYAALQKVLDHNPRALFQFDSELSYRLKPRFAGFRHESGDSPHFTNSRGLLGREEVRTESDVRRVLFLGDSVTYGAGVPFEAVFTSRLRQLAGSDWQFSNAGCPGWSTHQEILYYRNYLSDIEWDAICLVFCLNDLVQFEWVYDTDTSFRMSAEVLDNGGFRGVGKGFFALRTARSRARFLANEALAPLAQHNNTVMAAWDNERWDVFEKNVFCPLLVSNRVPRLCIAVLPTRAQIEALQRGAPPMTALFPQKRLEELCRVADIPFWDLTDGFCAAGENFAHLYVKDVSVLHLSAEGHDLAARILWPLIQQVVPP